MKKIFCKEFAFVIAMFTNSLAITLLVKSVFGVSTLSSLPLVLSEILTKISFGMMNFIVQASLLMMLIAITHQPKFTYIISFVIAFVFGLLVDTFDLLLAPLPNVFTLRIIYFITGWLLISFGAALFIHSSMPLMPFDGFIKDLSLFMNVKVKKVKTISDIIFVSLALILSFTFLHKLSGVGVGTIFMALFTGSLTQYFIDILSYQFTFKTCTQLGGKLEHMTIIQSSQ